MGMVVNQGKLAEILGRTDVTIWEWQKETPPLPVLKLGARGEEHEYDTAAVIAWWIEREVRKSSGTSQKDRLARLQGDVIEIELARERGTLVPSDEVKPLWETRVLTAAAFMASRHSRLAAILEAAPGLEAKREILKREDAEFLKKLGVDGVRMQAELDKFLEKAAAVEAEALLQRIRGDGEQRTSQTDGGGVGPAGPA
jgi:phage terminase Nu1 subunit (DNA packaging protein)